MTEAEKVAFVCIDIETTGLDYENDCILEVAIVLADEDLNEVGSKSWLVYPDTNLNHMNDFYRKRKHERVPQEASRGRSPSMDRHRRVLGGNARLYRPGEPSR